jgi:hypothetical protein
VQSSEVTARLICNPDSGRPRPRATLWPAPADPPPSGAGPLPPPGGRPAPPAISQYALHRLLMIRRCACGRFAGLIAGLAVTWATVAVRKAGPRCVPSLTSSRARPGSGRHFPPADGRPGGDDDRADRHVPDALDRRYHRAEESATLSPLAYHCPPFRTLKIYDPGPRRGGRTGGRP